jgi:hypothetical protein
MGSLESSLEWVVQDLLLLGTNLHASHLTSEIPHRDSAGSHRGVRSSPVGRTMMRGYDVIASRAS